MKKKAAHKPLTPARLREGFQNAMSAIAFAEENVPETARAILQAGDRGEYVLAVVRDDHSASRTVRYAVDLCQRMQCGLAILHLAPPRWLDARTFASGFRGLYRKLIGDTPAQVYAFRGGAPEAVHDFVKRHRRIVSIVLDAGTERTDAADVKTLKNVWWKDLRCPVVLIPAGKQ